MRRLILIKAKSLAGCVLLLTTAGMFAAAMGQTLAVAGPPPAMPSAAVTQRKVFVRSKALLVRAAVVENKLMKRSEFNQLGLTVTRNEADADIILELRHDVLTKYIYSAVDTRTQTVLAGGKVSSLGGTVAGKVAKRFLKQLAQGHP